MEDPNPPRFPRLLLPLLIFLVVPSPALSVNITNLLSSYPELSTFTSLLASTSVARDLSRRSSLTLLAIPNSILENAFDTKNDSSLSSPYDFADVVRYHVLLQYFSLPDLRRIPPEGKLVTTLFQTTGRASTNMGAVNLTRNPSNGNVTVRSPNPFSTNNATIVSLIKTFPYNISIFTVDSLLIPTGLDLMTSEKSPPTALNITQVLMDGKNFNVVASMLTASGVVDEFEADEKGAGITIFVPSDEAFTEMPKSGGGRLQSLSADRKAVVLRYHVLHSYYPLGSLESIVNPVQPTLATEDTGAGRFTLNISRVNGSVAIDTGIAQASITRTVFDQNPVAVFAVSKVLLPREIFGDDGGGGGGGGSGSDFGQAPAPEVSWLAANGSQVGSEVESPSTRMRSEIGWPPPPPPPSSSSSSLSPLVNVFSNCCIVMIVVYTMVKK